MYNINFLKVARFYTYLSIWKVSDCDVCQPQPGLTLWCVPRHHFLYEQTFHLDCHAVCPVCLSVCPLGLRHDASPGIRVFTTCLGLGLLFFVCLYFGVIS